MVAMGSQLPDEDRPRLRLERPSEHVAVVVIDAPAVANALNGRFFAELAAALDTIEQDDAIRVWLLTGAPRLDGRHRGEAPRRAPCARPRRTPPPARVPIGAGRARRSRRPAAPGGRARARGS